MMKTVKVFLLVCTMVPTISLAQSRFINSGDVIGALGFTPAPSPVPNTSLAPMTANTVKCNPTGSTANVQDCGSISLSATQAITVAPTGNTPSTLTSLTAQGSAIAVNGREFLANLGFTASIGNGGTAGNDKVVLYTGMVCNNGAPNCWSTNPLVTLGSSYANNAHIVEADLNNNTGSDYSAGSNPSTMPSPSAVGVEVSGAGTNRNTAAFDINGAKWQYGFMALSDVAVAAFYEFTNPGSTNGLLLNGAHTHGLNVSSNSTDNILQSPLGVNLAGVTRLASSLHVRNGGNSNVIFLGQIDLGSGATIESVNDVNSVAEPLEFIGTQFEMNGGGLSIGTSTNAGSGAILANTSIKSQSATAGVGYATGAGAGGAVTQLTSRTTGVTLNNVTGAVTLVSAAGNSCSAGLANALTFTVTDSAIAATDTVSLSQKSGADVYGLLQATNIAAGSFKITFCTTGGTTTEQPVFNFNILKGSAN